MHDITMVMAQRQYFMCAIGIAIAGIVTVSWFLWFLWASSSGSVPSGSNATTTKEAFADMAYPWMHVETLEDIRSLYHKILVIDTKRKDLGKCLLLNDEVQFCDTEERKYHELIVHFAAQYLPNAHPTNVLLVGGGDTMVLREVLKYGDLVKGVTILELDDMVTRVCEKHFGADRAAKKDNVKWIYGNVPASVKRLLNQDPRPKYDMIIVDTTETLDENLEIDSRPFFLDLVGLLSPSGVVVKNGEHCESIMKSIFSHTLVYGFDSKTYDARYQFMLGGTLDFRQHIVTTGNWFKHDIPVTFYDPDKHFDFLRWTDLFRRTAYQKLTEPTPPLTTTVSEFNKNEEERIAYEDEVARRAARKAAKEAEEAKEKSRSYSTTTAVPVERSDARK